MLFGLVIDFIMRHAVDDNNRGIVLIPRRSSRYPEVRLSDLDYADDIALFRPNLIIVPTIVGLVPIGVLKLGRPNCSWDFT